MELKQGRVFFWFKEVYWEQIASHIYNEFNFSSTQSYK